MLVLMVLVLTGMVVSSGDGSRYDVGSDGVDSDGVDSNDGNSEMSSYPGTTLTTPGGKPASFTSWATARPLRS